MIEPSLSVQYAIWNLLVASEAITATVPADRIFEREKRPEDYPCIMIGDGQTVLEPHTLDWSHVRVFSDVHVWTSEEGLSVVKVIAGNAAAALRTKPPIEGLKVVDWKVTGTRFLRDPGNQGHAIVSIEALVNEVAP